MPPSTIPDEAERTAHRGNADLAVSSAGIDISLIRWMLGLTPTERLQVLQGFVESAVALQNGRRS
jgi:hypothetical protein